MQEPIVHVLSKTTCSFAESRLSHGQRSPQTCLQLTIWDIVGRRVRRRPHKPEDINELADALQEELHVVVSRAWWRMETPLAMETSVKLTCWPLPNSKFKSRDSLKTFLLMTNVLSKYLFNLFTWSYEFESKQRLYIIFKLNIPYFFWSLILGTDALSCYMFSPQRAKAVNLYYAYITSFVRGSDPL